jgi:DNA-binding transcriptional regulator YhcF (GntR family)
VSPLPQPITLDRDAEVPLGVQLTWALRSRIERGDLAAGERLPSARELAESVGVNVNTVRAVYARLESDGLLAVTHGRGTFVAELARAVTGTGVGDLAAAVEREARARGIDPREVAAALYVRDRSEAPDDDAKLRRALREQIASLERQLATRPNPLTDLPPRAQAPRILSSAELEEERDALADRLRAREEPPATEPPSDPERHRSSVTRVGGAKLRWLTNGG